MNPQALTVSPLLLQVTSPLSLEALPSPAGAEPALLSAGDILLIVAILLLMGLSALFSASGTAYSILVGHEKTKIPDDKKHHTLLRNLRNPGRLLSTIPVVNLLTQVTLIVLSTQLATRTFLHEHPTPGNTLLIVLSITLVILLFCELLPKLAANRHPLTFARLMAYPLSLLAGLFHPLALLLQRASSSAEKKLKKTQKNISVDEISQALELTSSNDISEEKEILQGIVNFGNKTADEIMIPRVDVVAVDIKSSFTTVLDVINNSGYSRIPVYAESFDLIKGILYIKDLLPYTEKGEHFQWQNLLRPPFFVPETKKVKDLLGEFQKNKIHMAIVVDEYGGSSGIVTLEDVLEEIVGDIADEFDEDESFYTRLSDRKFLFDGKTLLDQFCEAVGCEQDVFDEVRGEADTLAGLILEIKGDIPELHEKIEFENFRFTIESVTNRRIRQIRTELL